MANATISEGHVHAVVPEGMAAPVAHRFLALVVALIVVNSLPSKEVVWQNNHIRDGRASYSMHARTRLDEQQLSSIAWVHTLAHDVESIATRVHFKTWSRERVSPPETKPIIRILPRLKPT
jgi:hypothetical protein